MPREIITLACADFKRRSYTSIRNQRNGGERLALNTYCRFERNHTVHREVS